MDWYGNIPMINVKYSYMEVSWNGGTSKSSILDHFSRIFHYTYSKPSSYWVMWVKQWHKPSPSHHHKYIGGMFTIPSCGLCHCLTRSHFRTPLYGDFLKWGTPKSFIFNFNRIFHYNNPSILGKPTYSNPSLRFSGFPLPSFTCCTRTVALVGRTFVLCVRETRPPRAILDPGRIGTKPTSWYRMGPPSDAKLVYKPHINYSYYSYNIGIMNHSYGLGPASWH